MTFAAFENAISSSMLVAQTGTTKTLVGWVIVALCVGLGLLMVCRPSVRQPAKKRKPAAH